MKNADGTETAKTVSVMTNALYTIELRKGKFPQVMKTERTNGNYET